MRRSLVLPTVFSLVASLPLAAQQAAPAYPMIVTSGHAESRIAPDRATVTLAVQTKGPSAATTAAANARIQQRVLDTLAALGLRAPDVSTMSFNVAPNMERVREDFRQNGYVAENTVTVRLRDLARIGAVIDAALARGANSVSEVSFESSKRDSVERVALANAAADARVRAEALAAALGGRVVELVDASTEGATGQTFTLRRAERYLEMQQAGVTPITPSDVTLGASVVTRWRFVSSGTR
jgi:uncharacterized protein YggE